ncbi:hypothetical protein BH09ACT7_BH09ACT7_30970 [soil metagenome]
MTGGEIHIGSNVRTTDEAQSTGHIVEDFGDLAGAEVRISADLTAKSRRWGVALDDGRIAFLDDADIELVE